MGCPKTPMKTAGQTKGVSPQKALCLALGLSPHLGCSAPRPHPGRQGLLRGPGPLPKAHLWARTGQPGWPWLWLILPEIRKQFRDKWRTRKGEGREMGFIG